LQPINNADSDGSYTINWTAAQGADVYVLEEAKDSAFSSATEIYVGPATSHAVAGRGAARYFYRVKSRNSWGDSGWSNTRQVDVLWEAEPNDIAPEQANGPLMSGLTYLGTFPSGADINDYYYVDLPTAGSVQLWLRNIPAEHNYDLVLRDADLVAVGYSGNNGNADEYIATGILSAARYFIQVYHRSPGGSSQPYHLQTIY
jgi:hypothetical protein